MLLNDGNNDSGDDYCYYCCCSWCLSI